MDEEVKTAQTNDDVNTEVADEESTETTEETTQGQESESQTAPDANQQKPAQSKEKNAEFARARRERERAEEIAKAKAEAEASERVKNVIEYVKTNPYTNKPITDAEGVNQYLRMKRIADNGGNPVEDYADEIDRESNAKREEEARQAESKAKIQSDVKEFKQAHPDVDLTDLLSSDELFRMLVETEIGNGENENTLNDVYDKYVAIKSKYEKQAEKKVVEDVAKKQSGVGSAKSSAAEKTLTKADILKMPYEERRKLFVENRALYESAMKK